MIGGEATELIKVFRKEKVSKEFNYVDFQNELANNYPNIPEIYRDVILKDTADQINLIQKYTTVSDLKIKNRNIATSEKVRTIGVVLEKYEKEKDPNFIIVSDRVLVGETFNLPSETILYVLGFANTEYSIPKEILKDGDKLHNKVFQIIEFEDYLVKNLHIYSKESKPLVPYPKKDINEYFIFTTVPKEIVEKINNSVEHTQGMTYNSKYILSLLTGLHSQNLIYVYFGIINKDYALIDKLLGNYVKENIHRSIFMKARTVDLLRRSSISAAKRIIEREFEKPENILIWDLNF